MPTASKVLVILICVVSLGFVWLATAVVESRRNWDQKVKTKAAEVAKVESEIETLATGAPEGEAAFKDLVEKQVLPLASKAANDEYQNRLKAGLNVQASFWLAMDKFIDQPTVNAYRQAVEKLNELQKTPTIEETQLAAALREYDTAEKDLNQARMNLEEAYAIFLGQRGTAGGIRSVADHRVEGQYKGIGIEGMKTVVMQIRQAIGSQSSVFATLLSDALKNETQLRDRVQDAVDEANTVRTAAETAERERDERTREVEKLKIDLAAEQMSLAQELEKLDKAIAALNDLQQQFDDVTRNTRKLVQQVREAEIRIDSTRGIQTAVLSPDGLVPTGKIQTVDRSNGAVQINIGSRVGVKPGTQLHVYRRTPEAKYLGLLEVTKSESDTATGRMLPEYRQLPIQPGDTVSTEIRP